MITVRQLFDWVKKNRRRTAFDYDDDTLVKELSDCCDKNSLLCITDDNGNIQGVVCWTLHEDIKVMFVMDILAPAPGTVKQMMKVFQQRFQGYTIEGVTRNKRPRNFKNTTKLLNRL